jgi:hypothetical protein
MQTNYTEYTKLGYKDIESLLITISAKTAQQYLTDIKKEFDIKDVLFCHFKQYFKIQEIPENSVKSPQNLKPSN